MELAHSVSDRERLAADLDAVLSAQQRLSHEATQALSDLEHLHTLLLAMVSECKNTTLVAAQESIVWDESPYYGKAEDWTWLFWDRNHPFLPLFEQLDLSSVLELACGHGRHSEALLNAYPDAVQELHLMDILESNIEFCKNRFREKDKVKFHVNSGSSFDNIESESLTSIFCYDAMVHFHREVVESYLFSATKVLRKDGRALFHHSNYTDDPDSVFGANPHARAFMSQHLIQKYANNAGLVIVEQHVIDWGTSKNLDCITLFEKQ